jgi:hypothetical protein
MKPSHTLPRVLPGGTRAVYWRLLLGLLLFVAALPASAQYNPLGYWQFESPLQDRDASGNGHHIVNNPGQILLVPGVAGTALDIPQTTLQPSTLALIDDSAQVDQQMTTEFWYRPSVGLHDGTIYWIGKQEIVFAPQVIDWYLYFNGAPQLLFRIELAGANALDPHQIYDGNWHHWVFSFNALTGEQKVYLDGQCPAGFSRVIGATPSLHDGGPLAFSYHQLAGRMEGVIDEFAVYDTVIPPGLVWQHYQQGLAGQHYTFTPTFAGPPVPAPATNLPGLNPLEFAPGYPNINMTTVELMDHYPMPRYNPNRSMRRLFPWLSSDDFKDFAGGGASPALWGPNYAHLMKALALNFNNYVYVGDLQGVGTNFNAANVVDPAQPAYHIAGLLNDSQLDKHPRATVLNWQNSNPNRWTATLPAMSFIKRRSPATSAPNQLPSHWFVHDSTNGNQIVQGPPGSLYHHNLSMANPLFSADSRLDSLAYDGYGLRPILDSLFAHLNHDYIDMVGENDEAIIVQDFNLLKQDTGIIRDMNANGWAFGNHVGYQAQRIDKMRETYRDPFFNYLTTLTNQYWGGILRTPELWWFEIKGGNRQTYPEIRDITSYRDSRRRPGPTFYPQGTSGWLIGAGSTPGWLGVVNEAQDQMHFGDSLMMPAVSPGFHHAPAFYVVDSNNIRPGCYLGILKAMHLLGSESFVTFDYEGNNPKPDANTRTWKLPIPAYAQAIGSRAWEFWTHGEVLAADSSYSTLAGGGGPTLYTFDTGNLYDLVVGRKEYGTERYLLTASVQRSVNMAAQAPKEKDLKIQLRRNNGSIAMPDLQLKARTQGNTFVLDLNNAAQPLIYQLDRWHEWKDMTWWCRDFNFEAEVWDSVPTPFTRRTELPAGAAAGDFREFTTYIELRTSGSQWADYDFRPRWDDQDTLYLWVKARKVGTPACTLNVKLGGSQINTLVINNSVWDWHGTNAAGQSIMVTVPAPFNIDQRLTLERLSGQADIDVIALNRSSQDFSSDTLQAIISATLLSACAGEEIGFEALGSIPTGCIDYHWRFGDGGQAYTAQTQHAYPVPGIYQVILDVTATCDGRTVSDTLTVHVRAPFVDAGPPIPVCPGDTAQLQGLAFSAFHWQADTALSDSLILDPLAWPGSLHWFTLVVDSAGCVMRDSTPVVPVLLNAISSFSDTTVCYGSQVQLAVTGAFSVVWDPNPTLSATNVFNPIATPVADSTVYYYTATDAYGCSTIRDSIVVTVVCCPGIPVTARLVNPLASAWAHPTTGGVYQIAGSFVIDVPITFSNTTFLMERESEIRIEQSGWLDATDCNFRTACGDSMWMGINMVHAGARLTMTRDLLEDAIKGVYSQSGANYVIRNSEFRDNWIGVHMGAHAGTHLGEVRGTRFTANAQRLLPPYAGVHAEAGVWVDQVGQATIGLPGNTNRNHFDSVAVGVLCTFSNVDVQNSAFDRILLKPDQKGRPGNGGYGCGVFARGTPGVQVAPFHIRVGEDSNLNTGRGCSFTDCPTGIYVRENIALRARRDTIDGQTQGVYGIRMDLNTADTLLVRYCQFRGSNFGIYSVLNSGAATRVVGNEFTSTDTVQRGAVYIYDFNTFNLHASNLKGTLINGNYIRQDGVGIEVNGVAGLEISNNTLITTGFALPARARTFAVSLNACDGAHVWANELTNQNLNDSISGLWLNASSRDTVRCNEMRNFDVDMRTWGSCNFAELRSNKFIGGNTGLLLESGGLIGIQGDSLNPTRNEWLGGNWVCGTGTGRYMARTVNTIVPASDKFYVRNVQIESPVHPSNPFCNSVNFGNPIPFGPTSHNGYVLACPTAGTGGSSHTNIAQQGGGYDEGRMSMLQAIAEGQTDYFGNADAARYLEQQMVLATLTENIHLLDDPILRDFWQAHSKGNMGRIMDAIRLAAEGGFADIPALLDFTPNNVLESTHQEVLMAYMRLMTGTWKGQDDSLLIAELAARCPLDYGKGVYQARAVMSLITPGTNWEDNCGSGQRWSDTQAGASQSVEEGQAAWPLLQPTLSPNPARGQVELACEADMAVEVFSSTGQLMARFQHKTGSTQVPVSSWAHGIYVFRYQIGDCIGSLRLIVE